MFHPPSRTIVSVARGEDVEVLNPSLAGTEVPAYKRKRARFSCRRVLQGSDERYPCRQIHPSEPKITSPRIAIVKMTPTVVIFAFKVFMSWTRNATTKKCR